MTKQPLGALPARFRRPRILIVGCGDIGQRVARMLRGRTTVRALTSGNSQRAASLRSLGVTPLRGNLDHARTLQRLSGIAHRVLHLAPPAPCGTQDDRTKFLLRAMHKRAAPSTMVYGSTSGVYGDCAGQWVLETRSPGPMSDRAKRRLSAEAMVHAFGRSAKVTVSVLRIPGIYAPDRPSGTPYERLLRGTPVLSLGDDVYTNHIHADDLARACIRALWCASAHRTYNINDDTESKMGDYFDFAADLYGLPRPPRVDRSQAQTHMSEVLLSFMSESRRLDNTRMKAELGLRLIHPTVREGLQPLSQT